jgi:hypothetical protein
MNQLKRDTMDRFVGESVDPVKMIPGNGCPECGEPLQFGRGCKQGVCPKCHWGGCN